MNHDTDTKRQSNSSQGSSHQGEEDPRTTVAELFEKEARLESGMFFGEEVELEEAKRRAAIARLFGAADADEQAAKVAERWRAAQTKQELVARAEHNRQPALYVLRPGLVPWILQPQQECETPERLRFLDFDGPSKANIPGAAGFENESILNDGRGGGFKTEIYNMSWSGRLPSTGVYQFWDRATGPIIDFSWRIDGPGIFTDTTVDAKLRVDWFAWLRVGGEIEKMTGGLLLNKSTTSRNKKGRVNRKHEGLPSACFRGEEGDLVRVYYALQFQHMTREDKGFASVDLKRFYVLRNYDVDRLYAVSD